MILLNRSILLFATVLTFFDCGKKEAIPPVELILQNQKFVPPDSTNFSTCNVWMAEAIFRNNTTDTVWTSVGIGNHLLICDITLYMNYSDRIDKFRYYTVEPIARYEAIPPKSIISRPVMAMCFPKDWICPIETYISISPKFTLNQSPFFDENAIKKWSHFIEDTLKKATLYEPKFYFHLDENCTRFRTIKENVDSMFIGSRVNVIQ